LNDIPRYLLVSASTSYSGEALATFEGYELHPAPCSPSFECWKLPLHRDASSRWDEDDLLVVEQVFYRSTWCREERPQPWERRAIARHGRPRRTGARRIPAAQLFTVEIYATQDTPKQVIRRAVDHGLVAVQTIWARPRGKKRRSAINWLVETLPPRPHPRTRTSRHPSGSGKIHLVATHTHNSTNR
jgi:hypothetical protein